MYGNVTERETWYAAAWISPTLFTSEPCINHFHRIVMISHCLLQQSTPGSQTAGVRDWRYGHCAMAKVVPIWSSPQLYRLDGISPFRDAKAK